MMPDLRQNLRDQLCGRSCLVGIGNASLGDDAFGLCLAERMRRAGHPHVFLAGNSPERFLSHRTVGSFDQVLLLDAVDVGRDAGAVVFMDSKEIISRFPQISTHKISLGLLARALEQDNGPRIWLLGAQPQSLRPMEALSPRMRVSLDILTALLVEVLELQDLNPTMKEWSRS